jgi:REP element-mobilizing transposase RayT
MLLDSWRWLQSHRSLRLFGYVVLENHLHFIASCEELSQAVGNFKSFTARQIIDNLHARGESLLLHQLNSHKDAHKVDRDFQLWQEGSHPQQIQNEEMMRQKLEYIHNNPVKRGYVDRPEHWRYSSARDYAGTPGLVQVRRDW